MSMSVSVSACVSMCVSMCAHVSVCDLAVVRNRMCVSVCVRECQCEYGEFPWLSVGVSMGVVCKG